MLFEGKFEVYMLKYTKKSLEAFSLWRNLVLTKWVCDQSLKTSPLSSLTILIFLLSTSFALPFMDMVISHVPFKFPTRKACTSFVSSKFAMGVNRQILI